MRIYARWFCAALLCGLLTACALPSRVGIAPDYALPVAHYGALALTFRVPGLKLFDIKCAWFDEEEYCEFFPRTLFANRPK